MTQQAKGAVLAAGPARRSADRLRETDVGQAPWCCRMPRVPTWLSSRAAGKGGVAIPGEARNAACGDLAVIASRRQGPRGDPGQCPPKQSPISLGTISPLLLVKHAGFAPRRVKELIEHARARPRTVAYASVGIGSPMHLSGELFKMSTNTELVHVPYKGGAPATAALLGGQEAQIGFVGMGPVLPHVKAGKLQALAISTAKRSPQVPQVPTLQEEGVKDFDTSIWFAFFAPAKTPAAIVKKLNQELVRTLSMPEVNQYLTNTGVDVAPGSEAELARFVKNETEKYRRIVQVSGTRVE